MRRRLSHFFNEPGALEADTAYAKAKKLKSTDAVYIAGLVDGEGTITLTREHANENRRSVVSISNTELPILYFVRDVCGIGKITSKRRNSDKHTPSYVYKVQIDRVSDGSNSSLSAIIQISVCKTGAKEISHTHAAKWMLYSRAIQSTPVF